MVSNQVSFISGSFTNWNSRVFLLRRYYGLEVTLAVVHFAQDYHAAGTNRQLRMLYSGVSNAQICREMQVNEMYAPYDRHHKVSSFLKSHQNTHNSVKYGVIRK